MGMPSQFPSMCSAQLSFYLKSSKDPEETWRVLDVSVDMDDLSRTYSLSTEDNAAMEPPPQPVQKIRCRL